jgi:hypothetical protein
MQSVPGDATDASGEARGCRRVRDKNLGEQMESEGAHAFLRYCCAEIVALAIILVLTKCAMHEKMRVECSINGLKSHSSAAWSA